MLETMQDVIELATAPDARERLVRRFMRVRGRTVGLVAPLTPEDQMIQSMPDVSPSKWHLAHTTWFFEAFVLSRYAPGYTAFDERYGYLFNSYYNKLGNRHPRPQRGMLSRPSWDEVQRYRDHVNAACLRLIRQIPDDNLTELTNVIILGLNHEQQHQELIVTDIKHVLWSNPLMPAYHTLQNQPIPTTAPQKWFEHRGGLVQIGCDPATTPLPRRRSASTARRRATTPMSGRSGWPAAPSPAANTASSSRPAATTGRNTGCPTAGTRSNPRNGAPRSTGTGSTGNGWSIPWAG